MGNINQMKKLILSVIISWAFLSCQKNDQTEDSVRDALLDLQGKYLVCDSVKTTVNGRITTQVLGKGKGWDRSFGLYSNLEIYSNPTVYKGFLYQGPDKIYYWNTNESYQLTQYFAVVSATSKKLVLLETEQATGKIEC
jgi:hypothetical protein